MMDAPLIDIRPSDWQIVRSILEKHVPAYEVLAFGSRARWEAKDYSDLDLAIITDQPLSLDVKSALDLDFAESDLPFKVDVVDWATASSSFREIIQRDKVLVREKKEKQRPASKWRKSSWGNEISLEYGKALRNYDIGRGKYRVYGSNGPIGWTEQPLVHGPGVILGRKGAYRGVYYSAEPFFVIDTAYYVVPKSELDVRWLYYAIKHHKLGEIDDGSPIPSTTRSAVYVKGLEVPALPEQHAISHILSTFDDKIELNRKMNETLEAMVRAIFKSWFVDFEPVRAKAERRNPGLPKPLANLFPDSFLDSELGEIPRGWIAGPILKHASLLSGGTPKTDRPMYWNGNILWASAKDVSQCGQTFLITTERTITNKGLEESATQLIPPLCAVVVARGATTGRMVLFGREMAMNQTCYALASTTSTPFFLYCQLRQETDALVHAAHGSVFDTITTSTFANSKVVLPQKPVLEAYEKMVSPLFLRILRNSEESGTLTVLRDTLLPKLISGELRVKAAAERWQQMPDQQGMAY